MGDPAGHGEGSVAVGGSLVEQVTDRNAGRETLEAGKQRKGCGVLLGIATPVLVVAGD
jgi:hypothetical protein